MDDQQMSLNELSHPPESIVKIAPHLTLTLQGPEKMPLEASPNSQDGITLTIYREQDGHNEPCIFKWRPHEDAFISSGLILLHIHPPSYNTLSEQLKVYGDGQSLFQEPGPFIVKQGTDAHVWEIVSGSHISIKVSLPKEYRECLVPGERYELLWTGGEIALWEWGTIKEYLGRELKPKLNKISLAGGSRVGFTVVKCWEPVRVPSPVPVRADDRVPGAPILTLCLEADGPLELRREGRGLRHNLVTKVTYDGVLDNGSAKPIIFHTYTLVDEDSYRLQRYHNNKWEECETIDRCLGFADNPDVGAHVGQHRDFVSLQQGDSWTMPCPLSNNLWEFPRDLEVGDIFRFRYNGGTVDWWDWGNREEHVDTVVMLPCWVWNDVIEPDDNGGRPKLVVPTSNEIELVFVG